MHKESKLSNALPEVKIHEKSKYTQLKILLPNYMKNSVTIHTIQGIQVFNSLSDEVLEYNSRTSSDREFNRWINPLSASVALI